MILILSDTIDQSTNDIIDWVVFYKKEFIILTNTDYIEVLGMDITNETFTLQVNSTKTFRSEDIRYFIYRKGDLNLCVKNLVKDENLLYLKEYFEDELSILKSYIIFILQKKTKKYIGDYFQRSPNKLYFLSLAKELGFSIPKTNVVTKRNELLKIYNLNGQKLITKAISESYSSVKNGSLYYSYTSQITKEIIEAAKNNFFPSLFQRKIEKFIELRVCFVFDNIYSMAMFYSNDEVDYRDDYDKVERMVPFKLPLKVSNMIKTFRREASLTTGSIDLLLDKDGTYYFLEVNPNGQFGFVSDNCNFYIEKYIIEYLINE